MIQFHSLIFFHLSINFQLFRSLLPHIYCSSYSWCKRETLIYDKYFCLYSIYHFILLEKHCDVDMKCQPKLLEFEMLELQTL